MAIMIATFIIHSVIISYISAQVRTVPNGNFDTFQVYKHESYIDIDATASQGREGPKVKFASPLLIPSQRRKPLSGLDNEAFPPPNISYFKNFGDRTIILAELPVLAPAAPKVVPLVPPPAVHVLPTFIKQPEVVNVFHEPATVPAPAIVHHPPVFHTQVQEDLPVHFQKLIPETEAFVANPQYYPVAGEEIFESAASNNLVTNRYASEYSNRSSNKGLEDLQTEGTDPLILVDNHPKILHVPPPPTHVLKPVVLVQPKPTHQLFDEAVLITENTILTPNVRDYANVRKLPQRKRTSFDTVSKYAQKFASNFQASLGREETGLTHSFALVHLESRLKVTNETFSQGILKIRHKYNGTIYYPDPGNKQLLLPITFQLKGDGDWQLVLQNLVGIPGEHRLALQSLLKLTTRTHEDSHEALKSEDERLRRRSQSLQRPQLEHISEELLGDPKAAEEAVSRSINYLYTSTMAIRSLTQLPPPTIVKFPVIVENLAPVTVQQPLLPIPLVPGAALVGPKILSSPIF